MSDVFPRLAERETSCRSLVFSTLCRRRDLGGWPRSNRTLTSFYQDNVTALFEHACSMCRTRTLRTFPRCIKRELRTWDQSEDQKMSLNHKDEHFTQLAHFENGKPLIRRMHQITLLRADGETVELTGPDLPNCIVSFAGDGHKGLHEAFVLSHDGTPSFMPHFRPKRQSSQRWRHRADPDWPTRRDVIHLAIGVIAIGILRFIATGSAMGGF